MNFFPDTWSLHKVIAEGVMLVWQPLLFLLVAGSGIG